MRKPFGTLQEVLCSLQNQGSEGIYFINGDEQESFLSYRELYRRALDILGNLQGKGVRAKDELILQVEDNQTFLLHFWACILGGIIPVPVSVGNNDEHKRKLFHIYSILRNPYIVMERKVLDGLESFANKNTNQASSMRPMAARTFIAEEMLVASVAGQIGQPEPHDLAFIQFSSGSTGDPKGVMLTHDNLLTNIAQMISAAQVTAADVYLSWMPLTHDMGLIGQHLSPCVSGANQYLMPTSLFIRRPTLWMKKASEHRVTITSSPNFGYKYFLTYFKPEQAASWDLSSIRMIFNGAEPIAPELCELFLEELAYLGLRRNAMFPVYGMAEASLGVTFPPLEQAFKTYWLKRDSLTTGHKVALSEEKQPDSTAFVAVGQPLEGMSLRICDDYHRPVEDQIVGQIQIKGDNVTRGYYGNEEATRRLISEGWLNTGDLGFMHDGQLVVTGRVKDIIFSNGQNYYPHDIERIAEELDEIELGYIAACGVRGEHASSDEVLLFVLYKKELSGFVPIVQKLKTYIYQQLGLPVLHVIPVRKIPKTTSGKFQRYQLGAKYTAGEFNAAIIELSRLIHEQSGDDEEELAAGEATGAIAAELAEIVMKVLEIDDVNVNSNFFDLGGNSLLVVKMQEEIERRYPGKVTVNDLFTYPTIRKLAAYLEGGSAAISRQPVRLQMTELPADFFHAGSSFDKDDSFTFAFPAVISQALSGISRQLETDVRTVLVAIYYVLLAKRSEGSAIAIHQLGERKGEAFSLSIDMKAQGDFAALVRHMQDSLANRTEQRGGVYDIQAAMEGRAALSKHAVLPLFCDGSRLGSDELASKAYDFILVHEERGGGEQLQLKFHFQGKRMRKEAMKLLLQSYIKLTEMIVQSYMKTATEVTK
ncbi:AMP-dependent synthetase and ligase [Paenibacillus curdlanolyticus YK9]|uniref:AMP-dependent synthetase and ligase n=1 Tax=Paenibacillus curdlanolyticus YK9 TaxID=717606 RepID=E0I4M8_9BACL|nr:non-ribosomal peptide synthetase [Paenibacillus curdlanolyticus]EFM12559.1 AMP-dependent synthetase and ligase [Paenibacillus curdlanolyticus YK9]